MHRTAIDHRESTSRSRRLLALLVLTALAALGAEVASARAAAPPALPASDPFYTYSGSTPLGQIAPGTVLRTRTIQMAVSGTATLFSADQVLYRTSGEQGQPTVTVTTIIKPLVAPLGTKIVAYQTAYDALGSVCDPSYTLAGGNPGYSTAQEEATIIEGYLAAGFTVNVSDYEGTNLEWAAGQESGYTTLDAIRAAENHLGAPSSTPVAMVGYSGGAIATEWASELAPTYAPALHIVGVAEGGIPVDFAHNLNYVNGSPSWSGVIPAVLVALSRAFGFDLNTYLSPYGKAVTGHVAGECINNFLGAYPGLTIQKLLGPQYQNPLAIPVFAKLMNELTMGTAPGHPTGPLFMAVGNQDGTGDGVMIAGDVEALAHEYCQQGVPVTFSEYHGLDHTTAAVPFEASALTFLEMQFLGLPAVNGCGSIGAGNSLAPLPVSAPAGCPLASGMLSGDTLGLVRLGMTRANARKAYTQSSNRHAKYQDFFCLTPTGVRVGYASPKLLRTVPRRRRRALSGAVVWISTANTYYSLRGVGPGATVASASKHLGLGKPFHVGANDWYLAPNGSSTTVLKVRHGTIEEIGIAAKEITRSHRADRAFLRSF
ncbi:MAG: lipase family protein [Actinomycetota bacterium]|nr:lipase family protein [Actinomycetota bacterium]